MPVVLKRYQHNPILQARTDMPWSSIKIYNPGISHAGQKYQMLFRGTGYDWVSRLGYAESSDAIHFQLAAQPVMVPANDWERMGCEDPRITFIDGQYRVTYTAFDGQTARAAIAVSPDLQNFHSRHLLFPDWQNSARAGASRDWSKAAAIFPKVIQGRYWLLFGDSHIWSAQSADLSDWSADPKPLLSSRPDSFDNLYVEMGPPPLLTDKGWLIIYHGVDRQGSPLTYRIGAALLNPEDPSDVIWRCQRPIIEPVESYETVGFVDVIEGGYETLKKLSIEDLHNLHRAEKLPRAIFCCGAVLENDSRIVRIYYGAGDTVVCEAEIDLDSIFES